MCVPFQIVSNCYNKILDIFYVIKDHSLLSIGNIDLFYPFPCNLHGIVFDWLESHAPFPGSTAKTIYILQKFHSVLCYSVRDNKLSRQQTALSLSQCLL